MGYGRTATGQVPMSFGPLNQDGGERRLNVLITRARRTCEVFTNLIADDIDLSRSGARGVRALKTFLQYAKDGTLEISAPTGREPDSPFEESVLSALEGAGYRAEPQVGSAGFFIDLAVVDPERPGRYLLGVECDGATYQQRALRPGQGSAAPRDSGEARLAHPSHLEHGLVQKPRTRTAEARGGHRGGEDLRGKRRGFADEHREWERHDNQGRGGQP